MLWSLMWVVGYFIDCVPERIIIIIIIINEMQTLP